MAVKIASHAKANCKKNAINPHRVAFHVTVPPRGSYVVDRIYKGVRAGEFAVSKAG